MATDAAANEMPQITASAMQTATYTPSATGLNYVSHTSGPMGAVGVGQLAYNIGQLQLGQQQANQWNWNQNWNALTLTQEQREENAREFHRQHFYKPLAERQPVAKPPPAQPALKQENILANDTRRRLVQIFVADSDEAVPLEHALLHRGDPRFTDLDDDELYFDLGLSEMLKQHNAYRITVPDEDASTGDKTVNLKPIRIRDLKMTVVTIASF